MKQTFSFIAGGNYVSPRLRVAELRGRRIVCASLGNLDSGNYGNNGNAGRDVDEEDGGSLF